MNSKDAPRYSEKLIKCDSEMTSDDLSSDEPAKATVNDNESLASRIDVDPKELEILSMCEASNAPEMLINEEALRTLDSETI